ncbi:Uncharacterised protein [Salmonella enterica subsp. enterica]|uniref:Uncharacterized protein n=1 Tax=Salmonella enterica I TaxID=59201 RepID=A0A3S4JBZ7_SALET|nr:Uncharacterised protein [Salmonella enterica subsp. enterica]
MTGVLSSVVCAADNSILDFADVIFGKSDNRNWRGAVVSSVKVTEAEGGLILPAISVSVTVMV